MEYIKSLSKLTKSDVSIAGGKGASLGEMTQAGLLVPEGYVILADTFTTFLKETDLVQEIEAILKSVNHEVIHTIENASADIQALILSRPMPTDIRAEILKQFATLDTPFVAVRSSATAEDGAEHAWAGQLDSFLNTTEADLIEKVQHCWASLFTPRAIFYRFEKGLHGTHIAVAVVVQKMVNSEKSGIAFSVHPVTEDHNQLIIEAGLGLGEAIVSGAVTPDSYVVAKNSRQIIDNNVNHQQRALYRQDGGGSVWQELSEAESSGQVLDESEINELAGIIIHIEAHYGFPCDIEWAYEQGKFYIVQSRPITTLAQREVTETSSLEMDVDNGAVKTQQSADIFGNKKPFFKINVSRDLALATFEVWVKSDTQKLNDWIGVTTNRIILENKQGIITAYEDEKIFEDAKHALKNLLTDKNWLLQKIQKYRDNMNLVAKYSEEFTTNPSKRTFEALFEQLATTQGGLAIVYFVPTVEGIGEEEKQLCLEEREATEKFFYDANSVLESGIALIHPGLKDYLNVLSYKEILTESIPSKMILEERKEHFIYYDEKFQTHRSIDDVEEALGINIEQKEKTEAQSEIKGTSAFAGTARGTAVIVLRRTDLHKVKSGDVMVCAMTNPDFLPAMKKAVAFITDEGGITSHAAITAREMKKPCITGTKIATQVLKDGDVVEVDADKGIITILNQSL